MLSCLLPSSLSTCFCTGMTCLLHPPRPCHPAWLQEIVRLLTTFDNHRLKQQKATERALASAHASHQGKQDVRLSGGQAGPGVQGEGSQASLEMEGRHSQLQRSGVLLNHILTRPVGAAQGQGAECMVAPYWLRSAA
jgi:hypothetical protein